VWRRNQAPKQYCEKRKGKGGKKGKKKGKRAQAKKGGKARINLSQNQDLERNKEVGK